MKKNINPYQRDYKNDEEYMVAITVRNNNVDQAMRVLKKKLQKEGVLKEIKSRQYFEKPSAKRARKKAEGIKRYKRAEKKRLERFN